MYLFYKRGCDAAKSRLRDVRNLSYKGCLEYKLSRCQEYCRCASVCIGRYLTLQNDRLIRALHDVKATDMGNDTVRFKAEVDFDGRELTRTYLDKQVRVYGESRLVICIMHKYT